MKNHPRGHLVTQVAAMPADTNMNGDVFGGWLVSHMDMGAAIAARGQSKSRVVTAAIEHLSFLNRVFVGETVSCYADLIKTGRTSMHYKIEAWTVSFPDEHHIKVAEGTFVFVAIDENGKPQLADHTKR